MGCCSSKGKDNKAEVHNDQHADHEQIIPPADDSKEEKTAVIAISPQADRAESAEESSVGAWLSDLGLQMYIRAFTSAGFDDQSLLEHLNENDLSSIEAFSRTTILPGHRKKVLLASQQLHLASLTKSLGGAGGALHMEPQRQMQLPGSLESPSSSHCIVPKASTKVLADSLVSWLPSVEAGSSSKPELVQSSLKDGSRDCSGSSPPPAPPTTPSFLPASNNGGGTVISPPVPLIVPPLAAPPTSFPSPPPPPLPSPVVLSASDLSMGEPLEAESLLNEVKAVIKQLSKREKIQKRSKANRVSAPSSLQPSNDQGGATDVEIDQKRLELETLHTMLESKVNSLKASKLKPVMPQPIIPAVLHVRPVLLQPVEESSSHRVSEIERKIRAKIEECDRVLALEDASTSKHNLRAPSQLKRRDDERQAPEGVDVMSLVVARKKIKSLGEIDREIQAKLNAK